MCGNTGASSFPLAAAMIPGFSSVANGVMVLLMIGLLHSFVLAAISVSLPEVVGGRAKA
jgi:hypothetical protein